MKSKNWIRTCQECGYKGLYSQPNQNDKNENWRNTKCRKCHSISLDYGRENCVLTDETWKQVSE
jgi:hypothetical protein